MEEKRSVSVDSRPVGREKAREGRTEKGRDGDFRRGRKWDETGQANESNCVLVVDARALPPSKT
jgi:hypothetical protein